MEDLKNEPRVPETDDLPSEPSHWSVETRVEGKYLHNLLCSAQKPDGASFDLLLVLDKIDLSKRLWTLFSDSLMPPPEPIQVETESEALLTWNSRPYWIPEEEDGISYGLVLEKFEAVEVTSSKLKVNHDN